MDSGGFLGRVKREVIGHPALTHPFLERFGDGETGAEGVRTFAVQYYRHVRVSRLYLAALISNCRDDEKLQLALAEVLFDEYGHLDPEETHPALYRRFLEALGIGEEEWEEPATLPEIEMYITTHYALSGRRASGQCPRSTPASPTASERQPACLMKRSRSSPAT